MKVMMIDPYAKHKIKLEVHARKFMNDPNVEVVVRNTIREFSKQAYLHEQFVHVGYTHYQEISYEFRQTEKSMKEDPNLRSLITIDWGGDGRECSEESRTGFSIEAWTNEEPSVLVPGWDTTEYQKKFWDIQFED